MFSKKKKNKSLQELTAFLNPGKQRLRELKSIRESALQRTLTNLQKNVKRRSKNLAPISENYVPKKDVPKKDDKKSIIKKKHVDKKKEIKEQSKKEEEQKSDEKAKDNEEEKTDKSDMEEVKEDDKDKEEEKIDAKKKPASALDEAPKTRRKTDKEKRLEREARERAEKIAEELEEMERLRAKWPTLKNPQKNKDAVPSGRLDDERWHAFLKDQFKILKSTPNVSNIYISAQLYI